MMAINFEIDAKGIRATKILGDTLEEQLQSARALELLAPEFERLQPMVRSAFRTALAKAQKRKGV